METQLEVKLFKTEVTITNESPIYEAAVYLHTLGLNVFPQPYASKKGYPWKQLQNVRLQLADLLDLIHLHPNDRCNLAVITGRTSRNLFVIDCEDQLTFFEMCQQVKKANIPLWAVETARGGHIYLLSRQGEVKNVGKVENGPNLEIRGNGVYVMASPSVHPDGAVYKWVETEGDDIPEILLSDINFLSLELAKSEKRENPQTILKDRIEAVSKAQKGSRNRILNEAAYTLGRLNLDRAEVEKALVTAAVDCGYVTDHGRTQTDKVIQSGLDAGERDSGKSGVFTDKRIEAAEKWLQNNPLTGKTRVNDTAVALALINRAKCESGSCFRASIRELAELARIGKNTVARSIDRLVKAGFPLKQLPNGRNDASLFSFNDINLEVQNGTVYNTCSNSVPSCTSDQYTELITQLEKAIESNTAERGALGKTGTIVYYNLLKYADKGIYPTELSRKTGLTVSQIKRGIELITDIAPGLIEKTEKGYRAKVNPTEFNNTQKQAHTTAEKRKARHQLDRAKRAYQIMKQAILNMLEKTV